MQLEALKTFCDIAELHSISKAAQANDRTQSAVSRVLQNLEDHLGVQLVDRSRRTLQLTPLGQIYYEGCKRLLDQYLELETSIRRAQADMALSVRVAAIYSVGLGDIRHQVEDFEKQHPHVKVQLDFVHPDQVYERVLGGTCDVGLVSYPKSSRELTILPWREEEMVVACTPTHPLAQKTAVKPALLEGETFVAFDHGLVIRQEVDRFLKKHGVNVKVEITYDNIEQIKKGIEIGAGIAILPEPMLRQEASAGTLHTVKLAGCQLRRPLGIIHRKGHLLGTSTQAFIDMLQGNGTAPVGLNGHSAHTDSLPQPRPKPVRGK